MGQINVVGVFYTPGIFWVLRKTCHILFVYIVRDL